jgi:hypothetical protein
MRSRESGEGVLLNETLLSSETDSP